MSTSGLPGVNEGNATPVNNGRTDQRSTVAAERQPRPTDAAHPSPASVLAAEIKALVEAGDRDAARERFGALVALLQRRALRIAFQYLRDAADADEAVQDAFVKVFLHIEQYRSDLPFDVWFTRILVNAALDRLKARGRQQRWISHSTDEENGRPVEQVPATEASHERRLLAKERWEQVTRGGGGPARSAAAGVHALPSRRADAGGNQRRDRHEPGHGARAFVQGVAEIARSAGGSGMSRRDISELDQNAALEAYRAAACAEADAHFDDRALETQRHKILARLAHLGHPAKVIRFPKAGNVEVPTGGVNRRWISVAAAAGLHHRPARRTARAPGAATDSPPRADGHVHRAERAVRPRVRAGLGLDRRRPAGRNRARRCRLRSAAELRALDEFTPLGRSALSAPVASRA